MCFSKNCENQVKISGTATLCFDETGSGFQGTIDTDDECQLAIYGTQSFRRNRREIGQEEIPYITDHTEFIPKEGQSGGVPVTFDIRIVDYEVGEEYSLRRVNGRNGDLCIFSCPCASFVTEEVFRGHRADLISQQCLGHKMAGKKTLVYRGPIRLSCVPTPRNFPWVL